MKKPQKAKSSKLPGEKEEESKKGYEGMTFVSLIGAGLVLIIIIIVALQLIKG